MHKKDKELANDYRPLSLLPICSEIFEKLVFDVIFHFLIENNLVVLNQALNQKIIVLSNLFQ